MIDNQNAVKISNILALFCEILRIECLGWMARSSRARSLNQIHRQKKDVLGVKSMDLALPDSPKATWTFGKQQDAFMVI